MKLPEIYPHNLKVLVSDTQDVPSSGSRSAATSASERSTRIAATTSASGPLSQARLHCDGIS